MTWEGLKVSYDLHEQAPILSLIGTAFGALFMVMNIGGGVIVWCAALMAALPCIVLRYTKMRALCGFVGGGRGPSSADGIRGRADTLQARRLGRP
jgi:hypothetical protein